MKKSKIKKASEGTFIQNISNSAGEQLREVSFSTSMCVVVFRSSYKKDTLNVMQKLALNTLEKLKEVK